MTNFVVLEIKGKQYIVAPGQKFLVDLLGEKQPEVKVLMLSEDGKVKVGKPYLDSKLELKVVEERKLPKIRVAKFHAKANYRRVTGIRPRKTLVELVP
ncbi:MAG: 50S ribosomal protein L21 [Candidatus Daviesbacteria bacterium]|nr:MAG: 50S ribosomal protein L21 [Candidatus Daviesbacteria bacterium]